MTVVQNFVQFIENILFAVAAFDNLETFVFVIGLMIFQFLYDKFYKKEKRNSKELFSNSLYYGIKKFFSAYFYVEIAKLPYIWAADYGLKLSGTGLIWLDFVLALLIIDLFQYWTHRLAHVNPFLWAGHQLHHSSDALNFTTAVRISHFIYLNFVYAQLVGYFVFRLSPAPLIAAVIFSNYYQFFGHSDYMKKNSVLSYIFTTPKDHSVHHQSVHDGQNSNFGGVFTIFDRFHGTYSNKACTSEYGCAVNYDRNDIFAYQFVPYINLWKKLKKIDGIRARISYLTMGIDFRKTALTQQLPNEHEIVTL